MSLDDPAYAAFVKMSVEPRVRSGLRQHQAAAALGRIRSVVAKIETRQRRIDAFELIRVAEVLGADLAAMVRRIRQKTLSGYSEWPTRTLSNFREGKPIMA
jgi:transcriptional regulator with XRE-family HTH domain